MKSQAAVGSRQRSCLGRRGINLWAKVMLVMALTLFVSVLGLYGPGLAQADVTSPTSPSAASGTNWVNPTNVLSSNGQYATFTGTTGNYLSITGFGFAIPAGSTINSVQATVVGLSSGSNATGRTIRLNLTTNGTAAVGTNKTQALTTGAATYNTTNDLWGTSLTVANVNSSTFGVLIRDNDALTNGTFSIDHVTLTVTYTLESTKPTITTFTVPATSSSLTISGITLAATDNIGVTGYLINESSTPPAAAEVNLATVPDSYTAASEGAKTLYAWARDAVGNVNNVYAGQPCTITLPAAAGGASLMHNSANLGTKYGTWGVAGGKYGEFVCTTCHNKTTNNIKRVAGTITAPQGNWSSSYNASVSVVFNNMTAFGNDAAAHTTSTQICQVCHSQTEVHRYNKPVGQTDSNHKGANQTDCTGCHSHADAFKGKGCSNCHGSTAASSNPITTGKHTVHIANAVYGCADCHAKSVVNDSTLKGEPTAHGNTYYGDYSGLRAGGSFSAGVCANVYCHTDGKGGAAPVSVNWTSGPAITDCKACHGSGGTYGEPAYVGGNSHAKHVAAAADCAECHFVTTADGTTIKPGGSHTNMSIEVDGSSSIGFNSGAKTCSSASCHANPYSTNSVTSPAWGTSAGCEACHTGANVITASGPATGSHTNVSGHAVACTTCHAAGTAADTKPSSGHADGNIDVANVGYATLNKTKGTAGTTCSNASCHSNVYGTGSATTPAWGSTGNGCGTCHTTTIDSTGPNTGSHAVHATSDCSKCHTGATNNTSVPTQNHADGDIDVNSGYPANVAKHTTASGFSGRTCSTASCHANVYGSGTVTSPVWGATAGCEACHTTTIAATGPATGSHASHATSDCSNCHSGATNSTTVPTQNHADGDIDVNSGYPANVAKHTTASGFSGRTCSTASCHANVYGSGTVTSPVWGATAGCEACHTTPIAATGPATGSHAAHATADCSKCHTGATNNTTVPTQNHADGDIDVNSGYSANVAKHATASGYSGRTCSTATCHASIYGSGTVTSPVWGATAGCEACHSSILIDTYGPATGSHLKHAGKACTSCHAAGTTSTNAPTVGHADGNIDIVYFNYPPNVTKHNAGSGYGTCSNISCHSPSTYGAPSNSATWGSTLTCATCHPESGLSGAHTVHIGELDLTNSSVYYNMTANRSPAVAEAGRNHGFGCANCHPMDTGNHVNGTIEVDLNRVNVPGVGMLRFLNHSSAQYVNNKCDNMYCHSNASRIEAESNVKSNTSLAWTDKFDNYTGYRGSDPILKRKTDRCAWCHGNQPTTGAHVAHAVSNHSDNIFNGKEGKVGFSGTGNSAHGNPNTTTTITCYICHQDTITGKGNDRNDKCIGCHGVTAPRKGNASISNLANHVNGQREIKFYTGEKIRSKAQVRPESFKFYSGVWKRVYYKNMTTLAFDEAKSYLDTATMWHPSTPMESNCSNLACHNGYPAKWNMANWNDPNKCMDCHFKL